MHRLELLWLVVLVGVAFGAVGWFLRVPPWTPSQHTIHAGYSVAVIVPAHMSARLLAYLIAIHYAPRAANYVRDRGFVGVRALAVLGFAAAAGFVWLASRDWAAAVSFTHFVLFALPESIIALVAVFIGVRALRTANVRESPEN